MTIRILVVDEHCVVRAGLCALLNLRPDLQVVGEAGDLDEARRKAYLLQPDVVLTEICTRDGVDLAELRQLKDLGLELHVLVLSASDDPDLARAALRVGVDGYIVKRASGVELLHAVRAVARGERYVHPCLTRELLGRGEALSPTACVIVVEELTPREVDVLRLVAQGYTNREAAELLALSVRTVEGYRANMMDKLGMRSRAELVAYAFDRQLLQDQVALA